MKPLTEKQAIWWKKIRTNGFFSYIKTGVFYVIFFFLVFIASYFFFLNPPSLVLWFLTITAPSFGLLIGQIFDWWRYERKFQLYLQTPQF
ncbi:MAG: hypothetical protein K1X72_03815 [Pyrinomonadaceae bacterium]|nr:hypothetical protein [Pyrinomonadaceae bacterium]